MSILLPDESGTGESVIAGQHFVHTNDLVGESSPYLLQHAHNPVHWRPWSTEALQQAGREGKPVLVSIGYAACHWCHVMERESFEDEPTAAFMNEHFINIKIDREERPDLDHIYMDAVQAMTNSGGWPLNVFLTPSGKPFYGGTYFPPKAAFNKPSWLDVLAGVSRAFREDREEIEQQATGLTQHLLQSNAFGTTDTDQPRLSPSEAYESLDRAVANVLATADRHWGGFGQAPKFPQTFSIGLLLRFAWLREEDEEGTAALDQALLSLDRMIDGGIYDQLGGGFARYSTDAEWLAPHFEKMLYDNALLVRVLAEALQLTGKDNYLRVIRETIGFVERELMLGDEAFLSALDADSEGEEGKFYTWTRSQVDEVLGSDSEAFCSYYDVTPGGNWAEHPGMPRTNILRVTDYREGAEADFRGHREKLLAARSARIRPGLDDKTILGWNALMNTALSKAYAATGEERWLELAERNMDFLLRAFRGPEGHGLLHTWKKGQARFPAFLDDYAFLIEALIELQEVTSTYQYLDTARELAEFVLLNFREEAGPLFYFTPIFQEDILLRKKELYDGAVPSGNSVMARNLHRLGLLYDLPEWKDQALRMVSSFRSPMVKYPGSFGVWNMVWQEIITGTQEIAVTGERHFEVTAALNKDFLPYKLLMSGYQSGDYFPLLNGRLNEPVTRLFLCKDSVCLQPVTEIEQLKTLISKGKRRI